MIELWAEDDEYRRVRCQTRARESGGQCLRFQDHGGDHVYGPRLNEDTAEWYLHRTSHAGLLKAFAALTHRLHVAEQEGLDEGTIIRGQRDRVEAEILRRMQRD